MSKQVLKILISYDDTGSMSSVRRKVRREIDSLVDFFFSLNFEVCIGIAIHNDYCDRDTIQLLPFTANKNTVINFIHRSSSQGGGDGKECYAYVLHEISKLDWTADKRICIMIGDAPPHEKGGRTRHWQHGTYYEPFDWREECDNLMNKGVQIYSIQCLGYSDATYFYEGMASRTNGIKLDLSQIEQIPDFLKGIAHHVNDTLDEFEDSQPKYKTNYNLRTMFNRLRGKTDATLESIISEKGESLGKFQVIEVSHDHKISDFVSEMGLPFRPGKGYYQFTKSEKIQANKEILAVNTETGETIADTNKCRRMLDLPPIKSTGGNHVTRSPRKFPEYKHFDFFIQSNSYTRKLKGGTKFLYEMVKK